MIDIVEIPDDGRDLGVADSTVPRAANLVAAQVGSLEYAPDFGIDKKYFLESPIRFQTESYKAHVIERLTQAQVNVSEVLHTVEALTEPIVFYVDDGEQSGGLIR